VTSVRIDLSDPVTGLLTVYALVFIINLVPAFMPPTWSILAFFLIRYHLPLLPLTVGGAVMATSGRVVLALASRRVGSRFLSPSRQAKLRHLGCWLEEKARWAAPLAVLIYSFGPIPSNELFIAAGLTGIRLKPIAAAFFVGRLVSYTFWALAARAAAEHLEDIFSSEERNPIALALQLVGIAILIVILRIDRPRLLKLPLEEGETRSGS
jgi:membrane protein YqaA with SNARE-associated domain